MTFTVREKLAISVLLILAFLIPGTAEWLEHDDYSFTGFLKSAPIWLVLFYLGPFWLYYLLQRHPILVNRHWSLKCIVLVLFMYCGAVLVNAVHLLFIPEFNFSGVEQVTSALLWGIFIFTMTQFYLAQLRWREEKRLREQMQWLSLTNRLNPHFLFNSLNTISALIYQYPEEADDMLHKLADILRYSLDKQSQWVSLDDELTICKTYIAIEQARFTDDLQVNWRLNESELNHMKVPPLLLQPLIENVMAYAKTRPLKLSIEIDKHDGQLVCVVRDNGDGFNAEILNGAESKGHGLDITRKRLAIVGGQLILTNEGGAVCTVLLPIV